MFAMPRKRHTRRRVRTSVRQERPRPGSARTDRRTGHATTGPGPVEISTSGPGRPTTRRAAHRDKLPPPAAKAPPRPAERPTLPKTGKPHIHLIYSKAAPAPVARISSASLPKRPERISPDALRDRPRPRTKSPARLRLPCRPRSAQGPPLPEITTSDSTSRPGRRTPCRPGSTPDRRTAPAAHAGQPNRPRLPPSPALRDQSGPPSPGPPSPEIGPSSTPDALPPSPRRDQPRSGPPSERTKTTL